MRKSMPSSIREREHIWCKQIRGHTWCKQKVKIKKATKTQVIKASMLFAGKVKLHKVPQSVLLCPFRLYTTKTKLALIGPRGEVDSMIML